MIGLGQGLTSTGKAITGVPTPYPLQLPGLTRWYKQPIISGSKWNSEVNHINNATNWRQSDANYTPAFVAGTSGNPNKLSFDLGNDTVMFMGEPGEDVGSTQQPIQIAEADGVNAGDFTIIICLERDSLIDDDTFLGGSSNTDIGNNKFFFDNANHKIGLFSYGDQASAGVSRFTVSGTPFAAGSLIVLMITRDANGAWVFSTRTGTQGDYEITDLTVTGGVNLGNKGEFGIGALGADTDLNPITHFTGDIYELLYYNQALSQTEREALFDNYLEAKYNNI